MALILLIIPIVKFKKWQIVNKLLLWLAGILLFIYSIVVFGHLLHYNQTKLLDKFYLGMMFSEYVKKFGSYPSTFNDLKKSSEDIYTLVERDYFFYHPQIKFLIDDNNEEFLDVTFYECGYDGKDDNLSKVISSPLSIFGINVKGDFLIVKQRYSKVDFRQFKSIN